MLDNDLIAKAIHDIMDYCYIHSNCDGCKFYYENGCFFCPMNLVDNDKPIPEHWGSVSAINEIERLIK